MATPAEELAELDWLVQIQVTRVIRRLPPNILREDLEAAGRVGLWKLLVRSPIRVRAFLDARIRGEIFDYLRSQDWMSRRMRARGDGAPVVVGYDDLSDSSKEYYEPRTDPKAFRAVERAMLSGAIEKLNARDQKVLFELFVNDRPQRELAVELGISEPRVSQLCSRAIERLRVILADPEEKADDE